jgi:nitroreductase
VYLLGEGLVGRGAGDGKIVVRLDCSGMDAYLAVVSKREVREYADRPIADDVKRRILEAGRIAGSSANKQQRRFVVVESDGAVERLAQTVYVPSNITAAGLVVAIVTEGKGPLGFDAGRAAQNMMIGAWNDGVGSCPNGTSDPGGASQVLGVGEDESIAIILSFGYPARALDPARRSPDEWIERAARKPFDEVVETI